MRPALDAGMKLAMILRHLATGDQYHTLQYDFRCGYSTGVWSVQEVCQVIIQELKDEVVPLPRTQEDWKAIAQQFQGRWNVAHALGALDGKHIAIRKPHNHTTQAVCSTTTKASSPRCCWPWWVQIISLSG